MTRWEAFTATCGFLRAGLLGGERPPQADIAWELMIEVASFHYVAPALAWCLRDEPMPGDVAEYFSSVQALNRQRNDGMLEGLARVAALLNGVGIEPVLLKGCAMLADDLYPDASLRLMGDADILIPRERAAEAVAALTDAGFATKPSDVIVPPNHHHLQPVHDPQTGLGLELHIEVMSSDPDAVIATDWFCAGARDVTFRGHRVRVPAPTSNAGHCIFHSQVFHGLHARRTIQLRYLFDLVLLRARHEAAIDWTVLDHRFATAGLGQVLGTFLHFAEVLFGQPAPALSHVAASSDLAELRRVQSRDGFQAQIESLQVLTDTLQSRLSRTMMERDQLQNELAAVARTHAKLEQHYADVLGSRSWRWTTPLRTLIAASRRWTR